jgi:hypothetical protein
MILPSTPVCPMWRDFPTKITYIYHVIHGSRTLTFSILNTEAHHLIRTQFHLNLNLPCNSNASTWLFSKGFPHENSVCTNFHRHPNYTPSSSQFHIFPYLQSTVYWNL